jgi:DNA-binding Lrp family transcriptional regulator
MARDHKLDRIDLRILSTLQLDGRIPNVKLADEVGLTPSQCLERLKHLEQAGYILRYGAEIDLAKFGEHVTVFAQVTLRGHGRDSFTRFEKAIRAVPEIVEAHKMGGGFDYLLKFVCADIASYQALSEKLIQDRLPIGQYFSYVVIEPVKPFAGYPLERLAGSRPPR